MTRHVFVPGGPGTVGAGAVRVLLAAGHRVTVPAPHETDDVRDRFPDHPALSVVPGRLDGANEARALREAVTSRAPVTDVVISTGAWWRGAPVGDLDPAEWDRVLAANLGAHFHAANTFLPVLAGDDPTYTLVTGGGALEPGAGSGPVSVSAAGALMLGRVLAAEQAHTAVRVTTLVVGTPVRGPDREGPENWLTADEVGTVAVALVDGRGPDDDVLFLDSHEDVQALLAE